jgi:NAD(P)-dependent dehydrogenase (short-subunit alcohol dehydrogenase family)
MNTTTRVAIVTGANRGLGYAIATQLAQRNIHVVAAARDLGQAAAVAKHIGGTSVRIDLDEPATITTAVGEILDRHARIDILINNAGISDGDQLASAAEPAIVEHVWHVNVAGAWRCASAVIPSMRAHRYGRIVNISSRLGSLHHMNRATEPAYRVSKAALNALTRVLAAELANTGILVNSASPGWVRTDLGGPNAPRDVNQGADTPVWLATLPNDGPTGGFFADRKPLEW